MWYAFYEVSPPDAYFDELETYTLEGDEIKFFVDKADIKVIGSLANHHFLISIPIQLFLNHNVHASNFYGYIGMQKF